MSAVKKISLKNLLAASLFPTVACGQPVPDTNGDTGISAETILTPDQVAKDVALAEEAYLRIHPGYTRYTDAAELAAAWDAVISKAAADKGMSIGDFYIEIEKVLTLIRCDHTKAELPAALAKDRNVTPVYLPLRWTLIEDRAIVTIPGNTSLKRGDEILEIDGRPLPEIVAEVSPLIPVDGYTEWSRRSGVSESLEFRGGAVDHFGALLWDIKPSARLTVKDVEGVQREEIVQRIIHKGWRALEQQSQVKTAANFKDAVTFGRIGENAGYLSVDTFVNYRDPVKPKKIFEPIFKAMKEEGRDTLILDFRRNGGGSGDAQKSIVSYLFDRPVKIAVDARFKTLDHSGLEPYLTSWDSRAINPSRLGFTKNDDSSYSIRSFLEELVQTAKPARNVFRGKLILLTSDNNSSGSAQLAALFKAKGRATLIGEKTGGSPDGPTAGVQATFTAPESKVRMRIPMVRYISGLEGFESGQGISPDIEIKMTVSDFREGRDPALDAAKSMAHNGK